MAIVYTQAQIDAAVNYLMTGGPNGGELTDDQYRYMVKNIPDALATIGPGCIITRFGMALQLAINQNHSGITNSHRLCRDQFGQIQDVYQASTDPSNYPGVGQSMVERFNAAIVG